MTRLSQTSIKYDDPIGAVKVLDIVTLKDKCESDVLFRFIDLIISTARL